MLGVSIVVTCGVYPAELQSIARALASFIDSVGKLLPDYGANTARKRPQSAAPSMMRELPLANSEYRLTGWLDRGQEQQVIDDVQRTAIAEPNAP
jgi:hypothetical protein